MQLARRSISSISWNLTANITRSAILFTRSVLLARLIRVEDFGVYAFAGSIIALSVTFANFGLDSAFIHRSASTEDEGHAASIHFTLKIILTSVWVVVMFALAMFIPNVEQRVAIIALTIASALIGLTQTPKLIMIRRVDHHSLAVVSIINAVSTTIVAVGLALNGVGLGALIATNYVTLVVHILAFYVWKPVWIPRISWHLKSIKYYLGFGSQSWISNLLYNALNEIDDLWTGVNLGQTQLGYYSRAYVFATYPRQILAAPINSVALGAYAELKNNRASLSKAFFRTVALLVRLNFLVAGCLFLIAPEFIRLFLGVKWMPMLDAFRLMLIFILLDPIQTTIAHLFTAQGQPRTVIFIRLIQITFLGVSLITLGNALGIIGVAMSMDVMVLVGILILLLLARRFVDFSLLQLFLFPSVALIVAMLTAYLAQNIPGWPLSDLFSGILKSLIYIVTFCVLILLLERKRIYKMGKWVISSFSDKQAS